jgi:hypothetical protein
MHLASLLYGFRARLAATVTLAGLLVVTPFPVPAALTMHAVTPVAHAQGGMDIGILTPSFSDLPRSSLLPGETFSVGVSTAPGARCSGTVTFRDHPQIDLGEAAAPGGACGWDVTIPPTVRPSTGTLVIPIARNGQSWTLYGIVYVRPVGESR